MKRIKETALLVSTLLFISFFSACDVYSYVTPTTQVRYENPSWAPPYVPGVRYYYLPDIETYYDLTTQQFIYLNNGEWSYSQYLPPVYSGFDLNTCFTVAIDFNTYQPWMHQHYYVSHYPRYYYRDYYDHSNIPYVRGYNENNRSAIYWSENERTRARKWDDQNLRTDRQFKYSESDRRQQNNYNTSRPSGVDNSFRPRTDNGTTNNVQPNRTDNNNAVRQPDNTSRQPDRRDNNVTRPVPSGNANTNRREDNPKTSIVTPPRISGFETGARQQNAVTPVRPNQNTNYYGRTIGQPVKVEKQMRERTPVTTQRTSETRKNNDSKDQNEGGRR